MIGSGSKKSAKGIARWVVGFIDGLERASLAVSVVSVMGMVTLIVSDLVGRGVFNTPIPGVMEVTEDFLLIGTVFLSLSFVYAQGGHIRVTLLRPYIPRLLREAFDVLAAICVLVLFGGIAWFGWQNVLRAVRFHEFSNSVLAYPMAPSYVMLTVGSALLCLRIAETLLVNPRNVWGDAS